MRKLLIFFIIWPSLGLYSVNSKSPTTENQYSLPINCEETKLVSSFPKKMIISLIGTSGSGKGTQGNLLSKWLQIPHISVGDLLREEFRAESKIGRTLKIYDQLFFPEQLPDEIPIGLLIRRLNQADCFNGYILDGFPRTELQANIIKNVLLRESDVHIPIYLDISEDEIKVRLLNRYYCPSCGHQVRAFDHNPWPGFCPLEASQGAMIALIHRPEDTFKEELERRLKLFRDHKDAILKSLSQRDPIIKISLSNNQTPDEVFRTITKEVTKVLNESIDAR